MKLPWVSRRKYEEMQASRKHWQRCFAAEFAISIERASHLSEIAEQETLRANATVRRMAKLAREGLRE